MKVTTEQRADSRIASVELTSLALRIATKTTDWEEKIRVERDRPNHRHRNQRCLAVRTWTEERTGISRAVCGETALSERELAGLVL